MEKRWWTRLSAGIGIGAAFIVPGIDGGTIAVITGVYDGIVKAISSVLKDFKRSFSYLLPLLIGFLIGFGAMFFPLKYAMQYFPFPTVALFAGLTLGAIPSLTLQASRNGFGKINILSLLLPVLVLIGLCYLPNSKAIDLSATMPTYQYFLVVLAGIIGAGALAVPGVSGSMVLLILGYYKPIVALLSELSQAPLHNLTVLFLFGLGVLIGLFSVAKAMGFFLKRFPRGTYWAIVGFILGSVIAVFLSFDYAKSGIDGIQMVSGTFAFLIGAATSFFIKWGLDKRDKKEKENEPV